MDAAGLVPSDRKDLVIHGWDKTLALPRRNPAVHIPAKVVARKAKDVVLQPMRDRGRGWKSSMVTAGGHPGALSVVGDLSPKDFKAVVVYAMEFEDMLLRQMGGAPVNIPYSIKIYADEKSFRAEAVMAGAGNAVSYYDPRTYQIVMFFDPKAATAPYTHDDLQDLLSHEFTHAFMDLIWKRTSPLWFAEGMATYFQHFRWVNGQAFGGALAQKQLDVLGKDYLLPLSQFVNVPRHRMYGIEFPQLYAQAWVTVHFFMERYPQVITSLLRGEKAAGFSDPGVFQDEWNQYFLGLYDRK